MTDKKLTDKEIKKALECCEESENCWDCPCIEKTEPCPTNKEIIDRIKNAPTADVIEVVRCKDCKYSRPRNESEKHIYFEGVFICESCEMADEPCAVCYDDYCSYGGRRTEDADKTE